MKRIDDATVELSRDEKIFGDFYTYLRDEYGMSSEVALRYLQVVLPMRIPEMLSSELLAYLDENWVPDQRSKRDV